MTVTTELESGDVQTITPSDPADDADAIFDQVWRMNAAAN